MLRATQFPSRKEPEGGKIDVPRLSQTKDSSANRRWNSGPNKLLTLQVKVLDYCQVTRFSKELEDSAQSKMHHLPIGTRLHRNISKGGEKRPGDGCAGFLSKMGVTIFTGTQVVWDGKRYVGPATQIGLQKFAPCIVVCIYIKSLATSRV